MADGALDFPFCLGRVWLADACRDPNGNHKIGKARIPTRLVLLHLQQDTLHAIRQRDLRQATKVFKRLHQAADERWGVATLHKGHKAHARIAQNGDKSIEFMRFSLVLVHKLAPTKLDLLSWFGLIALNRRMASHRRSQGMNICFQDTDPSRVAQLLQSLEEN